jgi:3'-5' exoribonuclease 1
MNNIYIVYDLEATCWDIPVEYKSEIIEIGAVKIIEKQIVDEFSMFIKPVMQPILSDFCKSLTHISQEDVDTAELFPVVVSKFQAWAGDAHKFGAWGYYDRNQLEKDSKQHGLPTVWLHKRNHFNIKQRYLHLKGFQKGCPLGVALTNEGLVFEGTPHRALADALNTAKIFLKYYTELTSSL